MMAYCGRVCWRAHWVFSHKKRCLWNGKRKSQTLGVFSAKEYEEVVREVEEELVDESDLV